MDAKYVLMDYDWYEANGDHILTLDVLHIPIDDPNNLRVTVTQGRLVEIEAVLPATFHSGERLEQLGVAPGHAMRVACNKACEKITKKTRTKDKDKKSIFCYRTPFKVESYPVPTLDGLPSVQMCLVPSNENPDVLYWIL